MPKIQQLTHAVSICIYADDHAPPHFHILGPQTSVQIRISDFQVMEGSYRRQDLAAALAWAGDNLAFIEQTWIELNERD